MVIRLRLVARPHGHALQQADQERARQVEAAQLEGPPVPALAAGQGQDREPHPRTRRNGHRPQPEQVLLDAVVEQHPEHGGRQEGDHDRQRQVAPFGVAAHRPRCSICPTRAR